VKKSSQVVVVTGAASNIGLAVARRFLKDTAVIGLES
jgi:NAD(P)-dependent dehydrogenase (short-subunit alcohol dehydrogenase family)